jgi:hypothetical protein
VGFAYTYINGLLNPHLVIEIFSIAQPFPIGSLIASAIITPLLFLEKYWTKKQRITVIILASVIVLPLLFNVIYGTIMGRRSMASIGLSMIGYPENSVIDGLIAVLECKELLFFSTLTIYTHISIIWNFLFFTQLDWIQKGAKIVTLMLHEENFRMLVSPISLPSENTELETGKVTERERTIEISVGNK